MTDAARGSAPPSTDPDAPLTPTSPEPACHAYRIDFSITRRRDGEDDFTEIGFGSSGAWADVDAAAHMVQSCVENREWETAPGMPEAGDA